MIANPNHHLFSTTVNSLNIDNYRGKVFLGPSHLYPIGEESKYRFAQTGSRPVTVVLLGSILYGCELEYTGETYRFIGNMGAGAGSAPADSDTAQTLPDLSLLVDDLMRLGRKDLEFNFPHLTFDDEI